MTCSAISTTDVQYVGQRVNGNAVVNVSRPASAGSHRVRRLAHYAKHSPTGFEWGYGGSGPADLALALLFDVTRDRGLSMLFHQGFKADVVARLDRDRWQLDAAEIRAWVGQAQSAYESLHGPVALTSYRRAFPKRCTDCPHE